jgi:hypothetical protein
MALNFPKNPTVGQIYTVNGESWTWDGVCWHNTPAPVTYSPVFIGTFPPSSANAGDLWWNSITGRMCIYYIDADSAQWVSAFQPQDQIVSLDSSQVVDALLTSLPEYANIDSAVANGVPTGGLFKIAGMTGSSAIRVVASYTP